MKKSFNLDSEINKLVLTEGIEKPSKDFVKNIMAELNPQKKYTQNPLISGKLTIGILSSFFLAIATYLRVNRDDFHYNQSPFFEKLNVLSNISLLNINLSYQVSVILICTLVLIIAQLIMIKRVIMK
jgi:hypothetical protein